MGRGGGEPVGQPDAVEGARGRPITRGTRRAGLVAPHTPPRAFTFGMDTYTNGTLPSSEEKNGT